MSTRPIAAAAPRSRARTTFASLVAQKANGEPIAMVTAYDYPSAQIAEAAGVDIVLVGDSAAMTVLGHDSTVPVTVDEMLMLASAVRRGLTTPLLVADLPFGSYEVSDEQAVATAQRFIKTAGVDAVKIERGGSSVDRARAIIAAGIPVMGHVGLTPQTAASIGGYRSQGRTAEAALAVYDSAVALQAAGCFAIVFEAIPTAATDAMMPRLRHPRDRHRCGTAHRRSGPRVPRPARHLRRAFRALREALRGAARADDRGGDRLRGRRPHAPLPAARARLRDGVRGSGTSGGSARRPGCAPPDRTVAPARREAFSAPRALEQIGVDQQRSSDVAECVEQGLEPAAADGGQLEVVRSELLELAGPDADDLPASRPQRPVFAPIRVLPSADMLEPEPPGAVVLDRDPQFGQQDVRPHLDVVEERPAHPHGVVSLGDSEPGEQIGTQLRLDRGRRSRRALADERLPDGQRRGLGADRTVPVAVATSRSTQRPDGCGEAWRAARIRGTMPTCGVRARDGHAARRGSPRRCALPRTARAGAHPPQGGSA